MQTTQADNGADRMYIVAKDHLGRDDIHFSDLLHSVWKRRIPIVLTALVFAAIATMIAVMSTEWYRVEVLLSPTEDRTPQGLASQFGGLATLAGIDVEQQSAEPIAVLRSRRFAREFILENDIVGDLLAAEQSGLAGWLRDSGEGDVRDAVEIFRDKVVSVREDSATGLVTLTVEWTDSTVAAEWASRLIVRLNQRMRERALEEAEANVEYLRSELTATNVVAIQQSIGRLLESELQKLMLAKGNEEYAFRTIDPAFVPKNPVRPDRILMIVFGTVLGLLLGSGLALIAGRWKGRAVAGDSAISRAPPSAEQRDHRRSSSD